MKPYVAFIIPIALLLIFVFAFNDSSDKEQEFEFNYEDQTKQNSPQVELGTKNETKPQVAKYNNVVNIDKTKKQYATLDTSEGKIKIELYFSNTPITASNFWELSGKGFYTNTIFHRVIEGFMIQGGDPKGDGTGGPGYRFDDEPFQGEYTRGTVAMANSGPNTNGSQFFIMHKDYPLPKNYVIFGKVVEGIEVVDRIAMAPVSSNSRGEKSTPIEPVKILSVTTSEE